MLLLAAALLLSSTAGVAEEQHPDTGWLVSGSIGRLVSGDDTGWEGSVLVDPGTMGDACQAMRANYGLVRGVELTGGHAHYTEGEVAFVLSDRCAGIGIPLAGFVLGAGTRSRGSEFAGVQATFSFFGMPWPFLEYYGRRFWRETKRGVPTTEFGLMFKIPVPIYGWDLSGML